MFILHKNSEQKKDCLPKKTLDYNFTYALICIQNLIENNQKYSNYYCKSYKSLEFSKTAIELAFNYLLDSIEFDSNSFVFNDRKFENELRGMYIEMLLTYVHKELNEIPKDRLKQIKFNATSALNLTENQFKITKLIESRNKEQWQSFTNTFEKEDQVKKECLEKIN